MSGKVYQKIGSGNLGPQKLVRIASNKKNVWIRRVDPYNEVLSLLRTVSDDNPFGKKTNGKGAPSANRWLADEKAFHGERKKMKQNRKSLLAIAVMAWALFTATNAWGQYGLYGSTSASDASAYTTQSASSPQPAVVYPAVGQQPFETQAGVTGPSLVAPSGQAAGAATSGPQYTPTPQYAQPQQTPQYVQYAQPQAPQYLQPQAPQYPQATQYGQTPATTPQYPSYQASGVPVPNYPSYQASPQPSPQPVVSYRLQGVVQQPFAQPNASYAGTAPQQVSGYAPQQASMYNVPMSPRFGTPQAPQTISSLENISPQPIADPSHNGVVDNYCDTPCESACETPCTSCETVPCCEPCCTLPWYVSVSGLVLGRDQANRVWTSHQANEEANQIMNTQDIEMPWAGGGEITLGRSFCCGTYGIEATYWQLGQVTGRASVTNPNGVSTPLDLRYLEVGPVGDRVLVSTLFDGAEEHRLRRSNEAYNVELNALYYGRPGDGFYGSSVNWLVGARFLKFNDDLLFSSLASGSWGGSGGVNEGYLGDNLENYLVGVQVGFQARSASWHRLSTLLTTKFGVYNNHIKNDFMLYRGDGYNAQIQPASGLSGGYPIHSTANVFSTVAEVDLGVEWNFNSRLSAGVGYRVIAISGIGLADNQIPFYIVDVPEIERIDCNGDLLLHGAFASLTYGF